MPMQRYKPEQIVTVLRQIEAAVHPVCQRWTPSVGPLGGISKVDSAVVVAASKGNSERGRA